MMAEESYDTQTGWSGSLYYRNSQFGLENKTKPMTVLKEKNSAIEFEELSQRWTWNSYCCEKFRVWSGKQASNQYHNISLIEVWTITDGNREEETTSWRSQEYLHLVCKDELEFISYQSCGNNIPRRNKICKDTGEFIWQIFIENSVFSIYCTSLWGYRGN